MPQPETFNPYQPPKSADFIAALPDQIIYDGKTLMIPKQFTFPPVCLKTGAVTDLTPQRRRKISWYPPLLALLIVVNILIFAIVAACVSKRGVIFYQLSRAVAQKRRNDLLRNWGVFALALVLGAAGIVNENVVLIGVAGVLLLVALILSMAASRFLWVKRIDATHAWLCGVPDDVARALVASYGRSAVV